VTPRDVTPTTPLRFYCRPGELDLPGNTTIRDRQREGHSRRPHAVLCNVPKDRAPDMLRRMNAAAAVEAIKGVSTCDMYPCGCNSVAPCVNHAAAWIESKEDN